MNHLHLAALSAALLCSVASISQAADTTGMASPKSGMQLSQSECSTLWQQAASGNASGLTESQASAYVTDFKAANPDGDSTIDQNEWMAACNKGLVKNSSSSGNSSGTSGSEAGKTSDRTPGNPSPERTPNSTNMGAGGTDATNPPEGNSDRTPNK
jgi:hypothetical protein